MKSDYLFQIPMCITKNYDFNPSNERTIRWAQGHIAKSAKLMKGRTSRPNKIYRGNEIPNNYHDCDHTDANKMMKIGDAEVLRK